jgi:diguanylate cyclase (GGDEF)-like protein
LNEVENAIDLAKKIIENTRKVFKVVTHEVRITTSIGISNYPDDGEDVEMLFKYADTAMYQVKKDGRDNCLRYKPSMRFQNIG